MSKKLFSKFYPILLRTPLHKTILEKYSSENIIKKFSDGWGGNADNGYELLKGYFSFYGRVFSWKIIYGLEIKHL